jgi:hypothetical protein
MICMLLSSEKKKLKDDTAIVGCLRLLGLPHARTPQRLYYTLVLLAFSQGFGVFGFPARCRPVGCVEVDLWQPWIIQLGRNFPPNGYPLNLQDRSNQVSCIFCNTTIPQSACSPRSNVLLLTNEKPSGVPLTSTSQPNEETKH